MLQTTRATWRLLAAFSISFSAYAGIPSQNPQSIPNLFTDASGGRSGTPAWGASDTTAGWTIAVRKVVRARLQDLSRARDVELFCPGYAKAEERQQVNCWVLLVAAISKFESNFQPASSFREPNGSYSVGLLALSPGECPNAPRLEQLKQAIPNLVCGTNRMASLIRSWGYIDGPAKARGASRYWSTLRAPYQLWDPTRNRHLQLGKRNLILPLVRHYRGSDAPTDQFDL